MKHNTPHQYGVRLLSAGKTCNKGGKQMAMIISSIMSWCQNDMEYLKELIDELQNIVNNEEEEKC